MANGQIIEDRTPATGGTPFYRLNIIDNGDGTCSVYVEDRANSDGVSTPGAVTATGLQIKGSAGSTPPGGLNTQLQYNNAGAFGGIVGATTDGTTVTFAAGNLIATNLKPAADGVTAFQVLNTAGSVPVLNIDTTNLRLGINNAAPGFALDAVTEGAGSYLAAHTYRANANAGGAQFFHARGTAAGPAALNANDKAGSIFFLGYNADGSFKNIGEIDSVQTDAVNGSAQGKFIFLIGSAAAQILTLSTVNVGASNKTVAGVGTTATSPLYTLDSRSGTGGQTASNRVVSGLETGSFDTTAGVLNSYAGYFDTTATRSAGANALTNIGVYAHASGGQVNVAALLDGDVQITGQVTKYNNVTTVGAGLPPIVGLTSQKAETTTPDANVLTVTPAAAVGTYRVSVAISVASATNGVISWTLSYTDSNGNAQSNVVQQLFQMGTAAPNTTFTTSAAGNYYGSVVIDVNNAGANIVVKWVGGGTTSAKMSASIERLN